MAQDTTPALVLYVGDGVQTRFDVPFDKGSFGEIKVAFVRRGLTDYTWGPDTYSVDGYLYAWNGGVYTKTLTVDTDTPLYDKEGVATGDTWVEGMYREPKNDIFTNAYIEWTGDPITANDVICIVRITEKDQPYSYPNNQKHIERALDHLSRQIQELQHAAENALFVDPSWNYTLDDERKMDPIHWLQTIVRSKGLTLREVRIDDGYIEYTTDDPDSETKTWEVIAGVKTGNAGVVSHIRETKVLAEDGITWIPYLEYSVDGGNSWKPAGRTASELEHEYVKKTGDTMSGPLTIKQNVASSTYSYPLLSLCASHNGSDKPITLGAASGGTVLFISGAIAVGGSVLPSSTSSGQKKIGSALSSQTWDCVYTRNIYNGYTLIVPQKAGTLATIEDVNAALANAGSSLTSKGVWYAKMDAGTTPPAAEDGTNYADFSQTDGQGNPIIVIYERQNGAWVQTETITPPANYNGYVIVTSKIWDIPEQTGQQGGQVNWDCVHKTFTPYPKIVSFEDAALTGNSTVQMPVNPTSDSIVNKGYVDNAIATSSGANDLFDTKWKDYLLNNSAWALSDGNWKTSATAYAHLADDFDGIPQTDVRRGVKDNVFYYRDVAKDAVGGAHPYAYTSFYEATCETVYCDVESIGSVSEAYDGPTSAATLLWSWGYGNTDSVYKQIPLLETIAGTEIRYFAAGDGHKIVIENQEANANAIYAATGIAWYYILDTTNQRFKLPRTQYAFVNMRTAVGAYVEPSAPNITAGAAGVLIVNADQGTSGAFTYTAKAGNNFDNTGGAGEARANLNMNASLSSSVYKNGATIQQPATEMYLYFYVGA